MITNQNEIFFLLENELWDELVSSKKSSQVAQSLSFRDGLRVAYRLLYNPKWDQRLHDYALKLFLELKNMYPKEWNQSWEYEALLGQAYSITCKYDERYESFKKAVEVADNPPPRLLLELARCCISPGTPPISYDDSLTLVKKVMMYAPYTDAIGLLSHIYSLKGDKVNEDYWTKILHSSDQDFHTPSIEPKFLVDEYLKNNQKFSIS